MLSLPLHHAYVIPGDADNCVQTLQEELKDLFKNNGGRVVIDAASVETLSIDNARQLSQRGRLRGGESAQCILRGFENITKEAQNALLKILEEPADGTHIFLVTPSPSQLLETVHSRVEKLDLCRRDDKIGELATAFLQVDTLPRRLEIADQVTKESRLHDFVSDLADITPSDRTSLREVLMRVSAWTNDVGRSDSQIAEFLAIAAGVDGEM